ncbi:MAG: hypothetical protein WBP89_05280 [Sedimenticolaceae bacterium]
MMKSMSKTFLTGLITILPVALTLYLLYWLVVSAETALGNVMRLMLPEDLYWPVGPEYSCSLRKIDMMKAVNGWEFRNVAGFRCS